MLVGRASWYYRTMVDSRLFWLPVSEALMIGVLVGAQREHSKLSPDFGIREFVLCAAVGAACGLQHSAVVTSAALAAVIVVLMAFRLRKPNEESGFTTDLSLLTVFALSYICALSESDNARAAVIGISVLVTFMLESKDKVRKFFAETLTGSEFTGTLLFLALVFIIYPILPEGNFGPYDGFCPRDIWTFVILVSFVSFGGYFLEKYMGASSGLKLTAFMGGIASTTATTLSLSKEAKHNPAKLNIYWQAGTLANAIQFPRLFAFLSAISPPISSDAAAPLLAAGAVGIAMAFLIPAKEIQDAASPDSAPAGRLASSEAAPDRTLAEQGISAGDRQEARSKESSAGDIAAKEAETKSSSSKESSLESSGTGSETQAAMPEGVESADLASKGEPLPESDNAETASAEPNKKAPAFTLRNPLTLGPALECGLILAIVIFINKVVVATMGSSALIGTSMIGGLVDVDAVAVSAADLFRDGKIVPDRAVGSVLLAVCMNAVFKTGISYSSGNPAFASRMAISFSVMLAVAALVLHFM